MLFKVSILPLVIGAVFNMILGALWYSPVLFAKYWMRESGVTLDYIEISKGKMGKVYMFTTVGSFVTSYAIGFIILNFGNSTPLDGIILAIILWLGTNAPFIVKNWGFEDRSIKLGIINHGYDLVVYIVVALLYIFL